VTPTARLDFPVRFAIVAAVVSTIVFFLACLGWANAWTAAPLATAATYFLRPFTFERPPRWAIWIGWVYLALYLHYALQPETQSDALHYHLTVATHNGFPDRISFYDVIPQGVEMLFALGYSLAGERGAKLIHLIFLILSVPLIVRIGAQLNIASNTAWAAALFYAITPVAGISATSAYNDAAMVFYILVVVHLLLQRDSSPVALGIASGFAYAVKFTGGLAAPIAFLLRPSWKLFLAATAIVAPWLIRSAILTGNPVAPLFNSLFPNPFFHISSERELAHYLRTYGDIPWTSIPLQLTVHGDALQGLLGPLWLAAPIGLLALRTHHGRILWLAAILAGAPWILNIGTRFLMPALPFLALALMVSLPRALLLSFVFTHAILSWPYIIPRYAAKGAWALGMTQPGPERALARLIETNTPAVARILDLANAPAAITPRNLINAWQTAQGDRLVRSLTPPTLIEWRTELPTQSFSAIRARFASDQPGPIAIHEIELPGLTPDILWTIRAWPNIWESPLALDGNLASSWATWQPLRKGMFYEVDFSSTQRLTEIAVIAANSARTAKLELWGRDKGTWRAIPIPQRPANRAPLNLRRSAMRYLRREGITHILAPIDTDAFGQIGVAMRANPADWNLEIIAELGNVALYRIR
jgi:hypothetical protein